LESEARDILREALGEERRDFRPGDLYAAIRSVIEPLGGAELDSPPREPVREPPKLG
jgi:plasmid stability protein